MPNCQPITFPVLGTLAEKALHLEATHGAAPPPCRCLSMLGNRDLRCLIYTLHNFVVSCYDDKISLH